MAEHLGARIIGTVRDRKIPRRFAAMLLKTKKDRQDSEHPLFPRLNKLQAIVKNISRKPKEPTELSYANRIRLLEAKVEFLLDENYRIKSLFRLTSDAEKVLNAIRDYQVSTFDYQWAEIVYHEEFLSNPEWMERGPKDVADRVGVPISWFRGKKILDCGCGPGRHTWVFGRLGAHVTAFDLAPRGLDMARQATAEFQNIIIERRSILDPLPYPNDFDLVWSYGVLHHTGNTLQGLKNIARHVKDGGRLYLMLYAEPRRDNVFDYQYQHEVTTLREATRYMAFNDKQKVFSDIDGPKHTLGWFDAISSEINDLYTFEEVQSHLYALGFVDVRRTMQHETMHNIVATKSP